MTTVDRYIRVFLIAAALWFMATKISKVGDELKRLSNTIGFESARACESLRNINSTLARIAAKNPKVDIYVENWGSLPEGSFDYTNTGEFYGG